MTVDGSDRLPPILQAMSDDARFDRVPASAGAGDVFIADLPGGCVVVAPPWTPLRAGENAYALTSWRFGWFQADADGVDLDAGPQEEGSLTFSSLWSLGRLSEHGAFLRASFVSRARHFSKMSARLRGEYQSRARGELADMRDEWALAFPSESWPVAAPKPTASITSRLSDVLSRAGTRLVSLLFPLEGQFVGVHGAGGDDAVEQGSMVRRSFGPHVALEAARGTEAIGLEIDFELLRVDEPDVAEAIAGGAVAAYLIRGAEDEVLAQAIFETTQGKQRVDLVADAGLFDDPTVRVALVAQERTA